MKNVIKCIDKIYEDIFQPATPEELAGRDKDRVKVLVQELISREDCTKNADGSYSFTGKVDLRDMNLTALPIKFDVVDGNFNCSHNQLTSLEGAPSNVGGYFDCIDNQLTSLEGAPSSVSDTFNCNHNKLTSLEGAPSTVGGGFNCSNNQLTSLEGAPSTVGGCGFDCQRNQLTSLVGAPTNVSGGFYCYDNKVQFTKEDVRKVSNVKGDIIV
jgi:hypothetical protein